LRNAISTLGAAHSPDKPGSISEPPKQCQSHVWWAGWVMGEDGVTGTE
jgi:hypothetical protein